MINEINYISINELASRILDNTLLSDVNIEQIIRHVLDFMAKFGVNNNIADNIKKGNTIELPSFMGTFEILKYKSSIKFENGKLKTNLPIDWNRTLELWENDKEAFRDKTVLRYELDYIYRLKYNPYKAKFNNKTIFQFQFIRDIKQGISKEIQKGNTDAILKYK